VYCGNLNMILAPGFWMSTGDVVGGNLKIRILVPFAKNRNWNPGRNMCQKVSSESLSDGFFCAGDGVEKKCCVRKSLPSC
jgi:hypothetical protein